MFEIKNQQVNDYYIYLNKAYHNQCLDETRRINAKKKMDIIEKLVLIYEYEHDWTEDDWDDIMLDWGKPIFPEESTDIIAGLMLKWKGRCD